MPKGTPRRSPLAAQLLLLLAEEPMHAYRMQRLIKARDKDRIVNIAQRNSVYQTLDRLLRAELVAVADREREPGRPERTIYRITDLGHRTLEEWVLEMLSTLAREFPEFPVALASLPYLSPRRAAELLASRAERLRGSLDLAAEEAEQAEKLGLPRLFLLEEEYRRAITRTELRWVEGVVEDLNTGRLTWDDAWLRAVSEHMEPREDQKSPNEV